MQMFDKALFDRASVHKTSDGYLAAFVRVARTGIQEYAGYEVGKPELPVVRVYRPEAEVFHKDHLHSVAHRPVTYNHPKVAVDASNWKEFARGQLDGDVVRDGEYIRVPMVMMDAGLVKTVEDGDAVELSMGYSTELVWGKGLTTDGKEYDAVQTQIRANHLAVVTAARGGSELRIGDIHKKETTAMEKDLQTITVDGISVQVLGDVSSKVISRHLEAMSKRIESLQTQLTNETDEHKKTKDAAAAAAVTAKTEIETRDGKVTALEKQVKDSEITPEKLDAMVKDRQVVIDAAKKIVPKITVDGKSLADIRKATVESKLGADVVKAMSDAAIEGAFSAITAGASAPARTNNLHESARAIGDSVAVDRNDARSQAYDANCQRLENAWKPKVATAA